MDEEKLADTADRFLTGLLAGISGGLVIQTPQVYDGIWGIVLAVSMVVILFVLVTVARAGIERYRDGDDGLGTVIGILLLLLIMITVGFATALGWERLPGF